MAIESKGGRRVKHAGNDGQAELLRERSDSGTKGLGLSKLRDTIPLLVAG